MESEKIHLWKLILEYDPDAMITIELIRKIANCGSEAGFKKSVRVTPEEIEMCQKIFMISVKDFDYEEQKPNEQNIQQV